MKFQLEFEVDKFHYEDIDGRRTRVFDNIVPGSARIIIVPDRLSEAVLIKEDIPNVI